MNTSIHILAAALTAASLHSAFAQETIHVSTRLGFLRVSLDQWHYARAQCLTCFFFLSLPLTQRQSVSFRRLPTQTDALKGPLHLSTTQFLGPTLKWISLQASVCLTFLLLHYNEPQAGAPSKLTFCDVVPLSRCPILGSPGEHGVHVHSYGDVSSATGAATGPHYNPFEEEHGCYPGARKVGDMGNVIVSGQGDGKYIELENTLMRLRGELSVLGRGVRSYTIRIATSVIIFFPRPSPFPFFASFFLLGEGWGQGELWCFLIVC